jgi:hypothetical protein
MRTQTNAQGGMALMNRLSVFKAGGLVYRGKDKERKMRKQERTKE